MEESPGHLEGFSGDEGEADPGGAGVLVAVCVVLDFLDFGGEAQVVFPVRGISWR